MCHRDIKLENILINHRLKIKVIDFGFGAQRNVQALSSYKGTKSFMAPEIRENQTYNGYSSDVFSAAVVVFSVVMG